MEFEAAIPGQSLTNEPKNYTWENPPQFPEPEEALLFHMEKLREPKRINALLDLLNQGIDVVTLTEGITRNAVSEGRHTVDVSLIISAIIHEYIVGLAEVADIDFNEGIDINEEMDPEERKYGIRERLAREILEELEEDEEVNLTDLEASISEGPKAVKGNVTEEKSSGLMSRPQGVN